MRGKPDKGGIGLWLVLIILVAGGWAGFRFGTLYFDNSTIANQVATLADQSLIDRSVDAKKEIARILDAYEVKIDPEKVRVDFNEKHDRITIAFEYSRSVDLGLAAPQVPFHVFEQRESARAVGVVQGIGRTIDNSMNNVPAQKYQQAVKQAFETPAAR
ncbi:MAG: hypothetical protein V1495_07380 [Pseudomonadota bacterium]